MAPSFVPRLLVPALGFAALALALSLDWRTHAQEKQPPRERPDPAVRQKWTTSKVAGSPDAPPKYTSVRAFPEVRFKHPVLFVPCPGSGRLFVGEQEGTLYSFANKPDAKKELFFDLRKELKFVDKLPGATGVGELYGLVFSPTFQKDRACYVCYTLNTKERPKDGRVADGSRVSRFRVKDADPPRIDPDSEEIVLTFTGGGHNGGDLHFGPDGHLYISTGDASGPNPPDTLNTGQDCSDLLSSVLRIDVNRKDDGRNYAVPNDNPFVGMKDVRPEVWAFGFRNPWRMSFDRKTGDLWLGDVGWELWEMVHKIEKGGNYGWSVVEGRQPVKPEQKLGPTPVRAPAIELPHTIAASVTGGYVYRGKKFPELAGAYVFGDWETRRIWAARFEGDRLKEMPELVKPTVRPSAFGEDNDGELYFCDYDSGSIYTLARNDGGAANTKFPTKLSDTGLFGDTARHRPADGVIPFYPAARQWQDGATAEYLLALPNDSAVSFFEKPRPLPGQVFWHDFKVQFPRDAVLVKTLALDVLGARGKTETRVETQLLHFDGEDWHGYSYAWRADQTDADLVPADGAEKVFAVSAGGRFEKGAWAPVGRREQVWTFHSRTQCLSCHNAWSEYSLAFTTRQLNRAPLFAAGKVSSQLEHLTALGYAHRVGPDDKRLPAFTSESAKKHPALAGLHDDAPLDARARSYLHANCAHCHRFGGGGGQVVLELDFDKPLKETHVLDTRPRQGDFGLPDARLVAPGDPFRSVLFYRMAKFGRGRMPHLGSEFPHAQGLDVVGEWISSLADPARPWSAALPELEKRDRAYTSFAGAWPFARALALGRVDDKLANGIAGGAAMHGTPQVRELFDGFQPPDPKGRKLGANPRPASVLPLKGDAAKGELIFATKEMKCLNCHKVGDKGTTLGPDLSHIGSVRTRAELLDSLLNPSARVEPQYAAYNVRTKDDKTYTGVVVKRDATQLLLRDAENKEIKIGGDNVDSVRPSRLSLMPDGQMSGLTPQEAADLLEYLVQRR
ncbi:MAG: PQQ-dependent sugar dehydrogenase [Gemmata sp.]